jgi:hypothetical protein
MPDEKRIYHLVLIDDGFSLNDAKAANLYVASYHGGNAAVLKTGDRVDSDKLWAACVAQGLPIVDKWRQFIHKRELVHSVLDAKHTELEVVIAELAEAGEEVPALPSTPPAWAANPIELAEQERNLKLTGALQKRYATVFWHFVRAKHAVDELANEAAHHRPADMRVIA